MLVRDVRTALLVAVLLQAVLGQSRRQSGGGPSVANIDVQCQKTGMQVQIQFSERFDGIIFSKGHFADQNCRYAGGAGRGGRSLSFTVPMAGCGTRVQDNTVFSNTVVLQTDPTIQEAWDLARTITCDWQQAATRKTVTFSPLPVAGMQAEEVRFAANESVSCGMDVQVGRWPDSQEVAQMVKVGSDLSLLMFAEDPTGQLDLRVGECRAYSSADFLRAASVQLTDSSGCVLKQKLMTELQVTRGQLDGRQRVIAFSYLSAFKFPDVLEVHFSCDVEVCKGLCPESCVRRDSSLAVTSQLPEAVTVSPSRRPVSTGRPAPTTGVRRRRPVNRTQGSRGQTLPRRTTPASRRTTPAPRRSSPVPRRTTPPARRTTPANHLRVVKIVRPVTTAVTTRPTEPSNTVRNSAQQQQQQSQPQAPTKDYPTFNINTKRDFPSQNALEEGSVRTDNLLSQLANIELGRLPGSGRSQGSVSGSGLSQGAVSGQTRSQSTASDPGHSQVAVSGSGRSQGSVSVATSLPPRVPASVTSRPPPGKRVPPTSLAATRVVQTPFGPVTVPADLIAGATNGTREQLERAARAAAANGTSSTAVSPATSPPPPTETSNFISFESPPSENEVQGAATLVREVVTQPPAAGANIVPVPVPIRVPGKRTKGRRGPLAGRKRRPRGPRGPFGLRFPRGGRGKRSVLPAEIRPVRLSRQVYVAAGDELAGAGAGAERHRRPAHTVCLGTGPFTAGLLVAAAAVLFGLISGCMGCWQRRQRDRQPKLRTLPSVERMYRRAR